MRTLWVRLRVLVQVDSQGMEKLALVNVSAFTYNSIFGHSVHLFVIIKVSVT